MIGYPWAKKPNVVTPPGPSSAPPGNVDPPGKIGGYADSPALKKAEVYVNRLHQHDFPRGVLGEVGTSQPWSRHYEMPSPPDGD